MQLASFDARKRQAELLIHAGSAAVIASLVRAATVGLSAGDALITIALGSTGLALGSLGLKQLDKVAIEANLKETFRQRKLSLKRRR